MGKPAAPTSLPPFTSSPYTAATTTTAYSSYSWDNQRQHHAGPPVGSANSTPINTPASEHSALTSTSTNYSGPSSFCFFIKFWQIFLIIFLF